MQVKQQDVNWLGQGLIQSAAANTCTQGLEHDLDSVNVRWKTLNKKVAQRTSQLQEALLHCGRFQDALESLLSWMADTEELVANQKPPSAEFKVVKAQIQEQKLLQRLLEDRKSTVEVIKREGEKIAASAEPADRVKLTRQLSLLASRWEALLSRAEARYLASSFQLLMRQEVQSGLWAGVTLAFTSHVLHVGSSRGCGAPALILLMSCGHQPHPCLLRTHFPQW